MRATLNSFKYAFRGVKDALKAEYNLRFHLLASILVIVLAFRLNFNLQELSILILTISSVISLEIVNTIIEKIVDLHSKEISEEARFIKDMGAGLVLISSIFAIIIGALLFIPKII